MPIYQPEEQARKCCKLIFFRHLRFGLVFFAASVSQSYARGANSLHHKARIYPIGVVGSLSVTGILDHQLDFA